MEENGLTLIIDPVLDSLGFETVRVLLTGNVRKTLQVMIDLKDGSREVTVDDCALASRAISKILDEKDPIKEQYTLEVSSPGIDRPLTKPAHFARFKNSEIKIETKTIVDERKRIKGTLLGIDEKNNVRILMDNKEYVVAFDNILKAKIVLTDELLEKYQADDTSF